MKRPNGWNMQYMGCRGLRNITIKMDDYGISSFGWNTPMEIVATDDPNVTLMPFDDVRTTIKWITLY